MKEILYSKTSLLVIMAVVTTSFWFENKMNAVSAFPLEKRSQSNLDIKSDRAKLLSRNQANETISVMASVRYRKGIKKCVCKNQ